MPSKWAALGITTSDISAAINNYTRSGFLGMVRLVDAKDQTVQMRLAITPDGKFSIEDLDRIPVKKVNGNIITLDKLVRATHQEQAPSSYFRING